MLRTILLVIGVLIILGIAFDGWQRKQRRLKLAKKSQTIIPEAYVSDFAETLDPLPSIEADALLESTEEADSTNNLAHGNAKVNSEKTSGPTPVEIEPIDNLDVSANQVLPENKPISPSSIQSANQPLPKSIPAEEPEQAKPINVISLTIMAMNSRPFAGYDIIRSLEENNLHHGEFDIYHRHKYRNGKGPLYFSVASIVKPGTIDPRRVGELSTPGLALFMELDNPKHDRVVFKQALATAHQIAKSLGGVVCDQQRVPLRESSLQTYAEKIKF